MPKPFVTGISPKEGYPGTKVVIRGENLGKNADDLVLVKICGEDCTYRATWEKEYRITTYTGFCKGKGDIIIVTKSGGKGTSSVGFQGLVKKSVDFDEETSVWINEDPKSILLNFKKKVSRQISNENPLDITLDMYSSIQTDVYEKEFPNTSTDFTKTNFNPARFLLEHYKNANFAQLKSGLDIMKTNIGSKTMGATDNLIKHNISSFMNTINILKVIQNCILIDKKNGFMRPIEILLKDISKLTNKQYGKDLKAKEKAEMIRNFLQRLDNFKSLLFFPQKVDEYLKNDDFEKILTGYKLSNMQLIKSEQTNMNLFSQIRTDLDSKIVKIQNYLLKRLVQFPSNPDEQKLLIDYFNAFEAFNKNKNLSNDPHLSPAWTCLIEEKKWFIQLMIECRDRHIADEKLALAEKQTHLNDSFSAELDKQDIFNSETRNGIKNQKLEISHVRNKFIEKICQEFFDKFTDFWRLGKIFLKELQESIKGNKDLRLNYNRIQDDFYKLINEILEIFTSIIRSAFIPNTVVQNSIEKDESLRHLNVSWPILNDPKVISQILPHCVKVCRLCALQIHSLNIPTYIFDSIKTLIYDLRCECLNMLLLAPTREIVSNGGLENEDWIINRFHDDENNYLTTNFLLRFDHEYNKALTLCKEYVIDDKRGERPLFEDQDFIKNVSVLLYGIVYSFLTVINNFASREDPLPKSIQIIHSKLLIYSYNNLKICRNKILPRIWNIIEEHEYQLIDQVINQSKSNIEELEAKLLNQYMIERIGPIVDSLEKNIYLGGFDFSDCTEPIAVRNYVKLIIVDLLNLQSELFQLNKLLISVVLTNAVKETFIKFYQLFSEVKHFCKEASVQTYVDIFCLKETLKLYLTDESNELVQEILKIFANNITENNKSYMSELIGNFQKSMQPYIIAFQQK